jgi:hypothetical protein
MGELVVLLGCCDLGSGARLGVKVDLSDPGEGCEALLESLSWWGVIAGRRNGNGWSGGRQGSVGRLIGVLGTALNHLEAVQLPCGWVNSGGWVCWGGWWWGLVGR